MRCLLIYDIPNDRIRTKVADLCLDYGLDRLQYSAFMGDISRNLQEELAMKIRQRMGKHDGNVQLIPICARDWAERISYVKETQKKEEDKE